MIEFGLACISRVEEESEKKVLDPETSIEEAVAHRAQARKILLDGGARLVDTAREPIKGTLMLAYYNYDGKTLLITEREYFFKGGIDNA